MDKPRQIQRVRYPQRCRAGEDTDATLRESLSAESDATSCSWPVADLSEVCHTAAILSSLLSTEVVKTDATSSSLCDGVDDLMQESSVVL